jgi:flagellar L-ring protein FlgH
MLNRLMCNLSFLRGSNRNVWMRLSAALFNTLLVGMGLAGMSAQAHARQKASGSSLTEYVQRAEQNQIPSPTAALGSLWVDQGPLANLTSDYKARRAGDLITILVVQNVQSQATGAVTTDRSFKASSGIDGIAGHVNVSGVQEIFAPRSSQSLAGKAQTSSTSTLRTALAGRVAAVLSNGSLVVEADRNILMNNERQTVRLRGIVRPGDIGPDNSVTTNAIAGLELELKGKGVISDGTRPPNVVLRAILRVVGF